jgi:hypothetical protein
LDRADPQWEAVPGEAPLFYLMAVFSCKMAGSFAPWALRLPSALMAMGTVAW